MNFRNTLILVLSLFLSFSLLANWPEETRELADTFVDTFENTFVSSMRFACNEPKSLEYFDITDNVKSLKVKHAMFKKTLPVKLILRDKKAPLMVIFMGVFTNVDDLAAVELTKRFYEMGHNVLVFPNPLSIDFIKARPKFRPGNITSEAQVLYSLTKAVVVKYRKYINLSSIESFGISYGSMLAAIINDLDLKEEKQLFKKMSLFSPPINLSDSFELLDRYIDESQDPFTLKAVRPHAKTFSKFCKTETVENFAGEDVYRLKNLVVYAGFHRPLINSVKKYDKVNRLGLVPKNGLGANRSRYLKWKQNFRFKTYFQNYGPDLLDRLSKDEGKIMYWINKAESKGKNRVNVLSTEDDFINVGNSWPKDDRFLVMKSGGHYGYAGFSWYNRFMESMFQK